MDQINKVMAEDGEGGPHVLIFPFPAIGHVHPALMLAELISAAGIRTTLLATEDIHARLLRSSTALQRFSAKPNVRCRTIPDGLPDDDPRDFLRFLDLAESLRTSRSREDYREVLLPSSKDADGWPRVSCVVADGILPVALEVPDEMGIPAMIFRTSSACSVWAYYSIPELIERGELPLPEEEPDMDVLVSGVRGMESFLRRRDVPGLVRSAKSADDRMLQYLITIGNNLPRARALILNSVEHIEADCLPYLRTICPSTYTIGPLQLLHSAGNATNSRSSVGLWREDRSCMAWLDLQEHKSVVYVSFGSITVMSKEAIAEFWHGLVDSGHPFLWVIRPDMIQGGADAKEVVGGGTTEKGCLVEWAPQEEVLAHPAVGCFLTHSGWNSTLESIVAGVPMICWPFFADQQINSRFVGKVWRIGIDMKDMNGRSVVEEMVRRAMDGEEAEVLRRRVEEMAAATRKSVEEGGSSYTNFQNLIQHIKELST